MGTPKFFIALMGIVGKPITISYGAPSVRGRQIFGDGGLVSTDWIYPVWRAVANAAKTLTTGGDLDIGGLHLPAGTYTLYVLVRDPENWQLIVNRQTRQGGHFYTARPDVGRLALKMDKAVAPVEKLRWLITTIGNTATIRLEWENHDASVPIRVA
jgi:hypothetical protein